MGISDWSSDVCSSDLGFIDVLTDHSVQPLSVETPAQVKIIFPRRASAKSDLRDIRPCAAIGAAGHADCNRLLGQAMRSEEHTSELQSLMRTSYAVFCLNKKTHQHNHTHHNHKRQHHTSTTY